MRTSCSAVPLDTLLLLTLLLLLSVVIEKSHALAPPFFLGSRGSSKRAGIRTTQTAFVTRTLDASSTDAAGAPLVCPDTTGITEEACLDTVARMRRLSVPVSSTNIHPNGSVGISYAYWPAQQRGSGKKNNDSPICFLIHGFDSSCLEYRRLGARLANSDIDTYAVDLLGWGFTQLDGVKSFSAKSKVEALNSFIDTILTQQSGGRGGTKKNNNIKFCIAGASLGGAAAIEVAVQNPACAGLILLDAQGFVDGVGPMAALPTPLAKLGVGVLKSNQLRSTANQMSYFDKKTFATDEAVIVGRLHCLRDGWSDALVSFMQSGGFSPSAKIPLVSAPALVLWGRQDGILDGTEFAPKFIQTLPNARLQWIENCGHVPHLEQPDETARVITDFVQSIQNSSTNKDPKGLKQNTGDDDGNFNAQLIGAAGLGVTALAAFAADFLPVH